MISFRNFSEAQLVFPEEPTGIQVPPGPLSLKFKEIRKDAYAAYYKGRKVAVAIVWKDLTHGKFSVYKSITHPDFRRRGVMPQLYSYIEKDQGKLLTPSSTLSDEAFEMWNKFRPEAVKDDLRQHRSLLLGKEYIHPVYGPGTISHVGSASVSVERSPTSTYWVSQKELEQKFNLPK